MSNKYQHIKHLPIEWVKHDSITFTVKLNGLIVANMTISGNREAGEQVKYLISFINISLEVITCYDNKEANQTIRMKCFDWLIHTIHPVWDAGTAEIQSKLPEDFTITTNIISGRPYDQ